VASSGTVTFVDGVGSSGLGLCGGGILIFPVEAGKSLASWDRGWANVAKSKNPERIQKCPSTEKMGWQYLEKSDICPTFEVFYGAWSRRLSGMAHGTTLWLRLSLVHELIPNGVPGQ
jgi:hypothetical protein